MNATIEQANDAKRNLLEHNWKAIKSIHIRLTDTGFRIELTVDPRVKWLPPTQVMGVPVDVK